MVHLCHCSCFACLSGCFVCLCSCFAYLWSSDWLSNQKCKLVTSYWGSDGKNPTNHHLLTLVGDAPEGANQRCTVHLYIFHQLHCVDISHATFPNKSIKLCKSKQHLPLVQWCWVSFCSYVSGGGVRVHLKEVLGEWVEGQMCLCWDCKGCVWVYVGQLNFSAAAVRKVKSDHSAGSAARDTPD